MARGSLWKKIGFAFVFSVFLLALTGYLGLRRPRPALDVREPRREEPQREGFTPQAPQPVVPELRRRLQERAAEQAPQLDVLGRSKAEAAVAEEREERREFMEELLRELRSADFLVPKTDVREYHFILMHLGGIFFWDCVEKRSQGAEENCEGLLFNNLFFAAGGHGRLDEFRRSWVHLFRIFGCKLEGETPAKLVEFFKDLWTQGFIATREIETAFFGAPLEGGDTEDFPDDLLPPTEALIAAWEVRNAWYQEEVYPRFWRGLEEILSEEDLAIVTEVFGVLNLYPP